MPNQYNAYQCSARHEKQVPLEIQKEPNKENFPAINVCVIIYFIFKTSTAISCLLMFFLFYNDVSLVTVYVSHVLKKSTQGVA